MSARVDGQYIIFVDPNAKIGLERVTIHETLHITQPSLGKSQPHKPEFYDVQAEVLNELSLEDSAWEGVTGIGRFDSYGGNMLEKSIA